MLCGATIKDIFFLLLYFRQQLIKTACEVLVEKMINALVFLNHFQFGAFEQGTQSHLLEEIQSDSQSTAAALGSSQE